MPSLKIPEGPWKLACDAETFALLRNDKEFHFLLTLSRMVLSLKLGIDVMSMSDEDMSPMGDRRRVSGFWLLCGTLHEIVEFDEKYRDVWGGLTVYVEAFKLFDPASLPETERELLSTIRNRTAFHFDPSIPGRVLPKLPSQPVSFLAGEGRTRLGASYELSEMAALTAVFGSAANLDQVSARFTPFFEATQRLCFTFAKRAETFIIRRLLARGFRFDERAPSPPPQNTT